MVMQICRGLKVLFIAFSAALFFLSSITGGFWIDSASARYYCDFPRTPTPDPEDVVWLPWRTFCSSEQTMPSNPGFWIIDDYPSSDISNCAEIGAEKELQRQIDAQPDCSIVLNGIIVNLLGELAIGCNGNVIDDYFIGTREEGYEGLYQVSCEGYAPYQVQSAFGGKYFVREPVGPGELLKEKNRGLPQCGLSAGNPVNIATGNKYHRQNDIDLPGGLSLIRHYNSNDLAVRSFGRGWRSNFSRRIDHIMSGDSASASLTMTRDDGRVNYWRIENSVVLPPPDARGRLEAAFSGGQIMGFTYRQSAFTETYDHDGKLISIEYDRGGHLRFTWLNSKLATVTNSSGRSLNYSYNADGLIADITSSGGSSWYYSYNQNGSLIQLTHPDGATTVYHYEDGDYPYALTGETNELGHRIRSWAYDASGRAVLSTFGDPASDIERTTISYHADGTSSTTDAFGHLVNHNFENAHGIARFDTVSAPCGDCGNTTQSASYDERGNRDIVIDFEGNLTDYDYNDDNLMANVTFGAGTASEYEVSYVWDSNLRKATQISRGPGRTNFSYNSRGQVLTKTETDRVTLKSRSWTHEYFEAPAVEALIGKLKQTDGPRTDVVDVIRYTYYTSDDAGGRYRAGDLHTIVNPAGHVTEYLEYDGHGRPLKFRDPNNTATTLSYHARGWISSRTIDGQTTSFTYDSAGNLTRVTHPDGSFMDYEYDDVKRLTAMSDSFNNRVEYTLDAAGNRISERTLDDSGILRRQLSRSYDTLNRLVTLTDGNGDPTHFGYDNNGNRTSSLDPNLRNNGYAYDALNRLVSTIDSLGGETLTEYDERGNIVSTTDPRGNATRYTFDGLNNQILVDSPDTGMTAYEYDAAGNRIAAIDARGIRTDYFYDALNRLTDISYPDSTLDVSFDYDSGPNGSDRLTRMTDRLGTVAYDYDARGNLLNERRIIGTDQYTTSYAYNAANRLEQITYPSGMTIVHTLDAAGRISAIGSGSETLLSNVRYEPFGPIAAFDYGNGLRYSAIHDQDYELDQLSSGSGLEWALTHDPVGNILSISDSSSDPGNQVYRYDELHRLETAQGDYPDEAFEYDSNGNRMRFGNSEVDEVYAYAPDSNHLLAYDSWTLNRDAMGNRTEKFDSGGTGQIYSYADHGRLTNMVLTNGVDGSTTANYQYDGRGQRSLKTAGGQTSHFVYGPDGNLLGEYPAGSTGVTTEYVYLHGLPVAVHGRRAEWIQDPGSELIVDNGAPGTSSTGSWQARTGPQNYGSDYLLAGKATARSYRWSASPAGANYQVFAWWSDKKNQSGDVNYTIAYGDSEKDSVIKSHKTGGGQWQLLGSYHAGEGPDYVEVSSSSNKFVADAVRWVEIVEPVLQLTESTHFIHFDHLGTPRQVSTADQTVIWRWDSKPFGDLPADPDPDGDSQRFELNLRFPGQYYDAESGLHYNYFRMYDPAIGRYLESDPIGLDGGLNTYAYVHNNPANYSDPFGLWVKRCARGLGDMNKPPRPPHGNPLRHDFISVSGQTLSFQAGDNPLVSQGRVDTRNELPDNPKCTMVCNDDAFDQYVMQAAMEMGAPAYCLWAYPGTKVHRLGARNCQTWVDDVLELAKRNYLDGEQCPACFN
jgi:RHS repeat-associated protein